MGHICVISIFLYWLIEHCLFEGKIGPFLFLTANLGFLRSCIPREPSAEQQEHLRPSAGARHLFSEEVQDTIVVSPEVIRESSDSRGSSNDSAGDSGDTGSGEDTSSIGDTDSTDSDDTPIPSRAGSSSLETLYHRLD